MGNKEASAASSGTDGLAKKILASQCNMGMTQRSVDKLERQIPTSINEVRSILGVLQHYATVLCTARLIPGTNLTHMFTYDPSLSEPRVRDDVVGGPRRA